jgi:hypothetical protein
MTQDYQTLALRLREIGAEPGWMNASIVVNRCMDAADAIDALLAVRDTALQRAEQAEQEIARLRAERDLHHGAWKRALDAAMRLQEELDTIRAGG